MKIKKESVEIFKIDLWMFVMIDFKIKNVTDTQKTQKRMRRLQKAALFFYDSDKKNDRNVGKGSKRVTFVEK